MVLQFSFANAFAPTGTPQRCCRPPRRAPPRGHRQWLAAVGRCPAVDTTLVSALYSLAAPALMLEALVGRPCALHAEQGSAPTRSSSMPRAAGLLSWPSKSAVDGAQRPLSLSGSLLVAARGQLLRCCAAVVSQHVSGDGPSLPFPSRCTAQQTMTGHRPSPVSSSTRTASLTPSRQAASAHAECAKPAARIGPLCLGLGLCCGLLCALDSGIARGPCSIRRKKKTHTHTPSWPRAFAQRAGTGGAPSPYMSYVSIAHLTWPIFDVLRWHVMAWRGHIIFFYWFRLGMMQRNSWLHPYVVDFQQYVATKGVRKLRTLGIYVSRHNCDGCFMTWVRTRMENPDLAGSVRPNCIKQHGIYAQEIPGTI